MHRQILRFSNRKPKELNSNNGIMVRVGKSQTETVTSLASLAVTLSHLRVFDAPNVRLEQYPTDSQVAAELLWNALLLGDIKQKVLADLGCGTGILGIGALLLGAKKVFFVDSDARSLHIAQENAADLHVKGQSRFICKSLVKIAHHVDVVIQNPPFGTKLTHADSEFLLKAFELAPIVYSMHKESTKSFIYSVAQDHGMEITHHWRFAFPLKATQEFHRKRIHRIDVGAWRFIRQGQK